MKLFLFGIYFITEGVSNYAFAKIQQLKKID